MTQYFKNRKQMFTEFEIDDTVENWDDIKKVAQNFDVRMDELEFTVVATSAGIYGINGAVIAAHIGNPEIGTEFTVGISGRTTFLFEMVG